MKILPETFVPAKADESEVGSLWATTIDGMVDVEFENNTYRAYAARISDGRIQVLGFVGKYPNSKKVWRVNVTFENGTTKIRVNYYRRQPNHNKLKVFYSPKNYFLGMLTHS
jgi:hypothetical protein